MIMMMMMKKKKKKKKKKVLKQRKNNPKFSRRLVKFSRAISRVSWWKITDVSDMFSETSISFDHPTRLTAQEELITMQSFGIPTRFAPTANPLITCCYRSCHCQTFHFFISTFTERPIELLPSQCRSTIVSSSTAAFIKTCRLRVAEVWIREVWSVNLCRKFSFLVFWR
jgi:hypothetical protein